MEKHLKMKEKKKSEGRRRATFGTGRGTKGNKRDEMSPPPPPSG